MECDRAIVWLDKTVDRPPLCPFQRNGLSKSRRNLPFTGLLASSFMLGQGIKPLDTGRRGERLDHKSFVLEPAEVSVRRFILLYLF